MLRVLLLRIFQALIVLFAVSVICFFVLRFVGDPVLQMLPRIHTEADYERTRLQLGLDDPLHQQYGRFLWNALHGDLGYSYHQSERVVPLILSKFPRTLELAVAAMFIAVCFALPLGIIASLRPRGILARMILTGSLFGISMPTFLTGILLIYVFAVVPALWPDVWGVSWIPRMPAGGTGQSEGIRSHLLDPRGWRYLTLPAVTLGSYYLAVLIRLVRSEMIQQLQQDYVKVARAKGLGESTVTVKHAFRNALIPVVTVMGMQFGGLIAFSVVTETIFQWPGMGKLLIDSIHVADRPVVMAYLLLVAIIFVTINFLVDLTYSVIDPRVRVKA